ncbi:MAG: 6-phosphogluconolactonase [Corynebacterium sp.]|nr:6-phosphogluconolactonase [Corynebacterium sp.]
MVEIVTVADRDALVAKAAQDIQEVVAAVRENGGRHGDGIARIVLTGGGAGIGTLNALAAQGAEFGDVHFFFGDERNVPVTDPESNQGQATAALKAIGADPARVHGYHLGELNLEQATRAYNEILAEFAPKGFDLHLLGMGGEGHINSLFPHTDALAESEQLVVAVYHSPKPPAERVTLTLPAVHNSAEVWLLVSGAEKAEAAAAVVNHADGQQWPAAAANATRLYLADDAAGELHS